MQENSGLTPGKGNGNPLKYSYLENPIDGPTERRHVTEVKTELSIFFFSSLLYFSLDSKSHILKEIRVPILTTSRQEQEMHVQIEMEKGSISQEQEGLQGAFYYECSTDASFSSVIQREKYKCAAKKEKKGKNKLKRRKKISLKGGGNL